MCRRVQAKLLPVILVEKLFIIFITFPAREDRIPKCWQCSKSPAVWGMNWVTHDSDVIALQYNRHLCQQVMMVMVMIDGDDDDVDNDGGGGDNDGDDNDGEGDDDDDDDSDDGGDDDDDSADGGDGQQLCGY